MTHTHSHSNRLVLLSALFAASACSLFQSLANQNAEALTALLLPQRAALMEQMKGERTITTAQSRRIMRLSTKSSSSSSRPRTVSAFRIRGLVRPAARTPSIMPTFGTRSSTGPEKARCGNGLIDAVGETCDDGNAIAEDGCSATCKEESGSSCYGEPSICVAVCGDAMLGTKEKCDDGNAATNDGCTPSCLIEAGWNCTGGLGAKSSCTRATTACGDGAVDSGETCDDGNTRSNDGCSNLCALESGFTCVGSPSYCGKCGDGVTQSYLNESCDDGNTLSGDGCSTSCQTE